jgi:hypothetical protein
MTNDDTEAHQMPPSDVSPWQLYQLVVKVSDSVSRLEERWVAAASLDADRKTRFDSLDRKLDELSDRVSSIETQLAPILKHHSESAANRQELTRGIQLAAASAFLLFLGSAFLLFAPHIKIA